jgi:hypothetical protein
MCLPVEKGVSAQKPGRWFWTRSLCDGEYEVEFPEASVAEASNRVFFNRQVRYCYPTQMRIDKRQDLWPLKVEAVHINRIFDGDTDCRHPLM